MLDSAGPPPVVSHVKHHIMSTAQIVILGGLEAVSLFMIVRVWRRKGNASVAGRCLWSLVLVIPLLGPLCYGFIATSPEEHGESLPEYPPDTGHL